MKQNSEKRNCGWTDANMWVMSTGPSCLQEQVLPTADHSPQPPCKVLYENAL